MDRNIDTPPRRLIKSRVAVCNSCCFAPHPGDRVVFLVLAVLGLAIVHGQPRHGDWNHTRCLNTYEANKHDVITYTRRLANRRSVKPEHHRLLDHHLPDEVRAETQGFPHIALHTSKRLAFLPNAGLSCALCQVQQIFSQRLSLPEFVLEKSVSNKGRMSRLRRLFGKLRAGL